MCIYQKLNYMKSIFKISLVTCIILISCNKPKINKIQVVTLAETTHSWDGTPLPKYLNSTPKVTILKITIPPKTKLELHKHLVINAGILLKGELTVIDENNNTLKLKEGDTIVELVNTYHYGKNDGDKPAEIVVFYAGYKGVPITVLKNKE